MQYTRVVNDAFTKLQMNAGIMVDDFVPSTGIIGNIMGATTGGFNFASNPNYVDFGEDMDNVPANTFQLKRITAFDPSISGTFLTVTSAVAKQLVGGAVYGTTGSEQSATEDTTHVIPMAQLTEDDFKDVWVIGDYSDKNTGTSAGFLAIHLKNALNTAGFQWQSTKDGKGQFAFEFHGHYDLENIDEVPFEIYVKTGTTS
jgi:hypothetical protein